MARRSKTFWGLFISTASVAATAVWFAGRRRSRALKKKREEQLAAVVSRPLNDIRPENPVHRAVPVSRRAVSLNTGIAAFNTASINLQANVLPLFIVGNGPSLLPFRITVPENFDSWDGATLLPVPGRILPSPEMYQTAFKYMIPIAEALLSIFHAPTSYDELENDHNKLTYKLAYHFVFYGNCIIHFAPPSSESAHLLSLVLELRRRCNHPMQLMRAHRARELARNVQLRVRAHRARARAEANPENPENLDLLEEDYPDPTSIIFDEADLDAMSELDSDNEDEPMPAPSSSSEEELGSFTERAATLPVVFVEKIKKLAVGLFGKVKAGFKVGMKAGLDHIKRDINVCAAFCAL